jgi:hypothetical protein
MLFASGWLAERRARHYRPPQQRLRSIVLTVAVAGATAAATYLLVNVALVTAARMAAGELSDAFAH